MKEQVKFLQNAKKLLEKAMTSKRQSSFLAKACRQLALFCISMASVQKNPKKAERFLQHAKEFSRYEKKFRELDARLEN
jgi:hypothetical protein